MIELLIVLVVAGVLLTLAAPSMYEYIRVQRLKSVNAQLVTDLQYARSEAVSRGLFVTFQVQLPTASYPGACYIIFTDTNAALPPPSNRCSCQQPAGSRCPDAAATELRTVEIPTTTGINLSMPADQTSRFAYDPVNGAIRMSVAEGTVAPADEFVVGAALDTPRSLSTRVGRSGRPTVCKPSGSTMQEAACPSP